MRVNSDFREWYDINCDGKGPVLDRVTTGGPGRRQQLDMLEAGGFLTPPHGLVYQVWESWWEAERRWVNAVVAYEDETAHCGEGKRLVWAQQLKVTPSMGGNRPDEVEARRLKGLYCTAFVGDHRGNGRLSGTSLRRLQVGPHVVWLEYHSTSSWMSNVGDGSVEVVGVEKDVGYHPTIRHPLWAADFVIGRELYGVDLNVAPGTRGTGLDRVMDGPEVVSSLEQAVHDLGNP